MGILSRILRNSVIKGGSLPVFDDFWYNTIGGPTKSGVSITEESALKYLTVFACVSLISGDIARLPLKLYRRNPDESKTRVLDHPLSDILHNAPNSSTTSFHFREAAQNHLLLWGNTFSEIKRASYGGNITGLAQITTPGQMSIKKEKKGLYYEWQDKKGKHRKLKKDIFHIAGFGFNGLVGMSMIKLAREAIGLGLAAEEFGSTYFGEGTHPAGIYEMDGYLGDNKKQFTEALKKGYAGLGKSHSIMIAEGGAKYKPLTIPLEDAQFLQTRDHQKIEICGMYHVPPHKIALHGQNSNYNNLEQENAGYVDSCLMHWIVRWEQSIALQLLTPEERRSGLFVEFLVDGLLRGDSQARGEFYNKMFQVGALSPNNILAKENMNPVEGGDQHFVQLNMIPLNMAGTFAKEEENKALHEYRAKSSILVRDRIAKQYYPLFQKAAQDIVNKESLAVKKQVNQQRKNRANGSMQTWLDDFYRKLPEDIRTKLGPVIRSFSEAIEAATIDEIGVDTESIEDFINDYIDHYAERHVDSSLGQLTALLEEDLEALETRVDEWAETRAQKIATNETVRASNGVYQAVAFGVGLSTIWRIRGAKTCPYCRSLNGKRIVRGESYVNDGDTITVKQDDGKYYKMKINGIKAHPPLHRGCFPGDSNVTAFGIMASSERWYDGNLIIIHTATGQKITCTPNHPIFTGHGWIAANKINKGDHVRKAIFSDRDASIISNNKNMPSFIEDVSKTFLNPLDMIAIPVPVSSKDFHNDGADSEVTIIRADGNLLRETNSALFHELSKFNFKIRDRASVSFATFSSFTEFIKSQYPTKSGPVGSFDLLLSLVRSHFIPNETGSLALGSELDVIFRKVFIDNHSGHTEPVGNGKDGFPLQILSDKVIRIENNSFHGLVYNLHTKDNLFYVDNIMVHNCDCYLSI